MNATRRLAGNLVRHILGQFVAYCLVAQAAPAVASPLREAPGSSQAGRSIEVTVRLSAAEAELIWAGPATARIDRTLLRPPRLDGGSRGILPAGTRELVAAFYDRRGRVIQSYGWPATGLEFFDQGVSGSRGELRGRLSYPTKNERTLIVPHPGEAESLVLMTATVRDAGWRPPSPPPLPQPTLPSLPCFDLSDEGRVPAPGAVGARVVIEPFSVVFLGADAPPKRAITFQPPFPGAAAFRINPDCILGPRISASIGTWLPVRPSCRLPHGYVASVSRLHDTGLPSERFDVVIVGDGFSEADLAAMDVLAERIKAELLATRPFDSLSDRLNIHLIRTVSEESGVTRCPDPVTRRTFFHVEGEWYSDEGEKGGPGYFGTRSGCLIGETIGEYVAPYEHIELVIMIVRCDLYGGKAEPENRLAFVSTYDPVNSPIARLFERLALHEAGHVIARLGEEYVACAQPDPLRPYPDYYPNIVPRSEVVNCWWRALLQPSEKDAGGDFLAVHDCGDPESDDPSAPCSPCRPVPKPPADPKMLGLFWGAQFGQASGLPNTCNVHCGVDPQNRPIGTADCGYYRSMGQCRMRALCFDFCRACEAKIREKILMAAP